MDPETIPLSQHPKRFVPFEKVLNFRDIGGYRTQDGRTLRWGQVYRAGRMSQMTAADQQKLTELGIGLVYDVRSAEEVQSHPNNLPVDANITHINRPVLDPSRLSQTRAFFHILLRRRTFEQMMLSGYIDTVLEHNGRVIGEFWQRVADGDGPAVVHCTAGKDRTGVTIALLLRLLGVATEEVVADYMLSNQFSDQFAVGFSQDPRMKHLKRMGYDLEDMRPLFSCDPSRLTKTLRYIDQTYGSIPNYLEQKAGLTPETQDQLKNLLLE